MDANDRRARETYEATVWWTRVGNKPPAEVGQTDREEFTSWLRESPLHVAELLRVAHVHDSLERFKLWDEIPLEGGAESEDIAALPTPLHLRVGSPQNARGMQGPTGDSGLSARDRAWRERLGWSRAGRWTAAASVCFIAVAAVWLAQHLGETTIRTDRAERREVMLSDGSIVNLEPQTTLRVNSTKSYRNVALERGRALFHVAKDPTRPFIVRSGKTNIRAVGTIFGVERENQGVIVTVSEGKVAVVPNTETSLTTGTDTDAGRVGATSQPERLSISEQTRRMAAATRDESSRGQARRSSTEASSAPAMANGQPGEVYLIANQQLRVQKSGETGPIERVDSSRALAWSAGRLVFDATPLGEVAAQFNLYNHVQLRIDGSDLARRPVSGVFQASDPETLISFISAGAHVNVERQGREAIIISASP